MRDLIVAASGPSHKSPVKISLRIVADMMRRKRVRYAVLGTITAAGLGLRLFRLGKWSFWRDEMFTVGDQEDGFDYSPVRQSFASYAIRQIVRRRGVDEWNARIVPALVGALSVPILHPVFSRAFSQPKALLATWLLATSPWHLYWSQNARFYSLLLLFYSLALFAFYLGLEEDNQSLLIASLLFLGLAARERPLALFFVPVVAAYLAILFLLDFPKPRGLHRTNLALFFLPAGIGAFLFARPYLLNLRGWMEGFGQANNSRSWLAGGLATYVGLPVVLLASGSALAGLRRRDRALLFTACGAFVPAGILVLIAPYHYTANRYGFVTLTSWLALASSAMLGLAAHLLKSERRAAVLGVLSVPLLQYFLDDVLYFRARKGNRADWKGALAFLREKLQAGDLVFSTAPPIANYYLQRNTHPLAEPETIRPTDDGIRVWIVEDTVAGQRFPMLKEWLARRAQLMANFDVSFWLRKFKMRIYLVDVSSSVKV